MKDLIHLMIVITICCLVGIVEIFIPEDGVYIYVKMVSAFFVTVSAYFWSKLIVNKIKNSK